MWAVNHQTQYRWTQTKLFGYLVLQKLVWVLVSNFKTIKNEKLINRIYSIDRRTQSERIDYDSQKVIIIVIFFHHSMCETKYRLIAPNGMHFGKFNISVKFYFVRVNGNKRPNANCRNKLRFLCFMWVMSIVCVNQGAAQYY